MGKCITVTINKGGSGKTTISTNIAFKLAQNHKVCLLDLDAQCGVSITVGKSPSNYRKKSILSVINENYDIHKAINQFSENLSIIYAEPDLKYYDAIINENNNINHNLNKVIKYLKTKFDYVVIDTPSTMSITNVVAMFNAEIVVIPFECERQNIEGVFNTLNELSNKKYNQEKYKLLIPLKFKSRALIDNELLSFLKDCISIEKEKWINVSISDIYIPYSSQYKNIVAKYKLPLISSNSNAKYILQQKENIENITNQITNLIN